MNRSSVVLQILAAVGVAALCANAECPDSTWVNYQDVCYNVFTYYREWADALKDCQSYGAVLASVHSYEQNTFIYNLMIQRGTVRAWIGLNDKATEATYKWADQSKYDYAKWNLGEPNNADGVEDCVEMHYGDSWSDYTCFRGNHYVCQIPY